MNNGGSGANDCKVYIELPDNEIRRTGWMLSDDNIVLSVALNVNIQEFVDMCAISADGRIRVITNEHGFRGETIESCVTLPGTGDIPATIRVASSNAQPVARGIILHANPIPRQRARY